MLDDPSRRAFLDRLDPDVVEILLEEGETKVFADAEILAAQGERIEWVGVVLEATHLCAVMRGVRKPGTVMTTSSVLGLFRTRDRTRAEFFAHLGRHTTEA